ncbi:MAG: ATP-binding protein [Erysipelotrichaceae bacterium]|nr:ATP-binding protein [Erysipelotrichaceae bacterium]
MGIYLNPDNKNFEFLKKEDIFVDKSLMISIINKYINKENRFICVSRPRRFGKSTDANMLIAYYSKGCSSNYLFGDLKISRNDAYQKHLNKYNIIAIDVMDFYYKFKDIKDMKAHITKILMIEIKREFPDVFFYDDQDLSLSLLNVYDQIGEQFIFILDEWDCVLRDPQSDEEKKKQFLEFLRTLFKTKTCISLVYMTGILPIKKYGDESALNMFDEISMIEPKPLEEFMGFTENEVKQLCIENNMDFNEMKLWYDGYQIINEVSIYSPRSIVKAISTKTCRSYWTKTGTFDSLSKYINMNFDGLKETIIQLLAGEEIKVDTEGFQNDMSIFKNKDDVLTMLVHLGYLGYHRETGTVYIPNKEVVNSFIQSIKTTQYEKTYQAIYNSQSLLESTWQMNEEKVAKGLEEVHDSFINSNLKYNDENSLYTTIMIAYYTSRDYYTPIRELPTGKGFCDIAFIPFNSNYPAMIIELKYDKNVETTIDQIKNKNYVQSLEHYHGNLLLVGINYDKKDKKHIAKIEKFTKE